MKKAGKTIKLRTGEIGTIGSQSGGHYNVSVPGKPDQLIEGRLIRRVKRQRVRAYAERTAKGIEPGKRWDFKEVGGI